MSINQREFEKINIGDFEHKLRRSRNENTVKQYLWTLKKFDKFLAERNREPNPSSLDDFIIKLQRDGESRTTQTKHYWIVKYFLERECGFDDIKDDAEPPKPQSSSMEEDEDYPSPESCQKLVSEIPENTFCAVRDKAIISTIFSTGARRGEIARLDRSDFNPPHLVISREKKRSKPEKDPVMLDDTTEGLIQQYLSVRDDDNPALFVTYGKLGMKDEPSRISGDTIYHVVRKWSNKILNRKFSPHKLRHSRASQLAREGIPMKKVAEFLSITTQTADRIYSHLSTADIEEMPDAFEVS